jgi:hypothetical protein
MSETVETVTFRMDQQLMRALIMLITLRNDILLKIKYLLFFRGFHLNTSCAKVYPCHELQSSIDESIDSMVVTDTMIRDLTTIKPG